MGSKDGVFITAFGAIATERLARKNSTKLVPEVRIPDSLQSGQPEKCVDCGLNAHYGRWIENLYESANEAGKIGRGLTSDVAEDMKINDYNLEHLKNIPLHRLYNPANYVSTNWNSLSWDHGNAEYALGQKEMAIALRDANSDYFFRRFYDLVRFFSRGEKQTIAISMVDHFKNNQGADFDNTNLAIFAKDHDNTRTYMNSFKKLLKENISRNNGGVKTYRGDTVFNSGLQNLIRPKFNLNKDRFDGMTIMVHDTHGMQIHIKNYRYCAK